MGRRRRFRLRVVTNGSSTRGQGAVGRGDLRRVVRARRTRWSSSSRATVGRSRRSLLVVGRVGVFGRCRHRASAGSSVVTIANRSGSARRVLVAPNTARSSNVARVLNPASRGARATVVGRWRAPLVRGLVVTGSSVAGVSVSGRGNGRSVGRTSFGSTFASRALHCVLRNFDNLTTATLLAVGALREGSVNLGQLRKHGLVQLGLVGMDGGSMLTQVVQSRESLATVAREGPLACVLAGGRQLPSKTKEGKAWTAEVTTVRGWGVGQP